MTNEELNQIINEEIEAFLDEKRKKRKKRKGGKRDGKGASSKGPVLYHRKGQCLRHTRPKRKW